MNDPRIDNSCRRQRWLLALILAATVIAYLPAMRGEFLWDDGEYVAENPNLQSIEGLKNIWLRPSTSPQYYPLVFTTFWIETQLFGLSPVAFHLTNVMLHCGSALLLYRLLKCLMTDPSSDLIPLLAVALFALHPVMVESVAWITERKNTLSLFFYLAGANAFLLSLRERAGVRGAAGPIGIEKTESTIIGCPPHPNPLPEGVGTGVVSYVLALLLFLAALFSKTVTATFPAAMLVILWWKHGRISMRDIYRTIPFFLIGIPLALHTAHVEATHVGANISKVPELNLSFAEQLLIAGRVPWFYFSKLILPLDLSFIYPRWNVDPSQAWQWIFPAALIFIILWAFAMQRVFGRGLLAGILLFVGTLFPVLGFIKIYPMRFSFVADHFQYHAAIPILVLMAFACTRLRNTARWGWILPLLLGAMTFARAGVYQDRFTLWLDTCDRNPDSWMVNSNLGNLYLETGLAQRNGEMLEQARRYYLQARDLNPTWHETHYQVGNILMLERNYDAAAAAFEKALSLNPDFSHSWFKLGQIRAKQQRWDDALRCFERVKSIFPDYPGLNEAIDAAQSRGG